MEEGLLDLDEILHSAVMNNSSSIIMLLQNFIADTEEIVDCGYLGMLGLIFPEYSFWCVTSERLCSLRIKKGGEMSFTSAYLEDINSNAFYQPSILKLVLILIVLGVTTAGIGLLLASSTARSFYKTNKSGVVFSVKDGIPIYIYADRNNLKKAQKISTLIVDLKHNHRITEKY